MFSLFVMLDNVIFLDLNCLDIFQRH